MEAAYRFFDNDKVSPENILQPHIEATRERVSQTETVLLVQDTTDLDLTRPQQQVRGAGPMEYETRRGFFFHPLIAFNDQGLPLGIAWQKSWARSQIKKMPHGMRKLAGSERRLSKARKLSVGSKALRAAREVAEACPQTTLHLHCRQ